MAMRPSPTIGPTRLVRIRSRVFFQTIAAAGAPVGSRGIVRFTFVRVLWRGRPERRRQASRRRARSADACTAASSNATSLRITQMTWTRSITNALPAAPNHSLAF